MQKNCPFVGTNNDSFKTRPISIQQNGYQHTPSPFKIVQLRACKVKAKPLIGTQHIPIDGYYLQPGVDPKNGAYFLILPAIIIFFDCLSIVSLQNMQEHTQQHHVQINIARVAQLHIQSHATARLYHMASTQQFHFYTSILYFNYLLLCIQRFPARDLDATHARIVRTSIDVSVVPPRTYYLNSLLYSYSYM